MAKSIAINGSALREIRKLLGVRTEALADEVGVHYSFVANLESGHRKTVSPPVFKALCNALRLDDVRAIMATHESVIDEAIARLIDEAPPLTEYQRSRLAVLLEVESAK
jgi:transcriptional regulator with XRE-family HTH domain